jgi:D-amino-acid oxidase
MPWLERRVLELGGKFEEVHFESLAETDARDVDVVVNASGLGAREIVPDPLMRPIRGQIVCAPNDIQLAEAYGDSGRPGDSTYVFPFDDRIVIGGTYEVGAEREAVDEAALANIVERARTLLAETGHPQAQNLAQRRLSTYSGLRPARTIGANNAAIRLEIERRPGRRPIVHDYGHAGVGVTLSWGCAEDVVTLVDSLR